MRIKHDHRILFGFGHRVAVFGFILAVILFLPVLAVADVGAPPPTPPGAVRSITEAFPTGRNLINMGYDPVTQTFKPQYGSGSSNTRYSKVAQSYQGHTPVNVTMRDQYGNAVTGRMTAVTQFPSGTTLANLGGALIAGQVMGSGIQRAQTGGIADAIADGNYGEAARIASASVADAVYAGAFSGINNIINDVQSKKADAVAAVARAQAEAAAADASNIMPDGNTYVVAVRADDIHSEPITYIPVPSNHSLSTTGTYASYDPRLPGGIFDAVLVVYSGGRPWGTFKFPNINPLNSSGFSSTYYIFGSVRVTSQNINLIKSKLYGMPQPVPSDFFATESEIVSALLEAMNRNTQTLDDVLNALVAAGLRSNDMTTTVAGSESERTLTTAPYTAADTGHAQQTKFVVAPSGTVTVSVIPRPDLAAGTLQAPRRQKVGTKRRRGGIDIDIDIDDDDDNVDSQPKSDDGDLCKDHPDILACVDVGEADQEDIVLPRDTEDLSFRPADKFDTGAECPQPSSFNLFGRDYAISYEPTCRFAAGARPWFVGLGMFIAMGMVVGSVREM